MVISPEKLTEEVLQGLLESVVTREGTDYGETELSLEEKVFNLLPQVYAGDLLITYDEATETVNLVTAESYRAAGQA